MQIIFFMVEPTLGRHRREQFVEYAGDLASVNYVYKAVTKLQKLTVKLYIRGE